MTQAQESLKDEKFDRPFETDVSRLLDIVANALYSNKDVFLRELISNAADACDRLRYDALQNPDLIKGSQPFNITLTPNNKTTTLTITDNGIGMNRDDLIENLGTIARSGTAAILENLKNSGQEKDINLIGQFGVGFYASFMVAKDVTVISRKAGDSQTWYWHSDGRTGFNIREASDEESKTLINNHGTSIILNMKGDGFDYLLDDKIKDIVLSYSDHIEVPIYLHSMIEDKNNEEAKKPIN
ncbi:MAG TPA: ATP-binding protein, partial [Alphaproteobacteria bacterium]|nr:ATP-binding protein [Alphaproteobacteria bacterium]